MTDWTPLKYSLKRYVLNGQIFEQIEGPSLCDAATVIFIKFSGFISNPVK